MTSISELKSRLRKLDLEMPTTILEKAELVQFVEEAERQLCLAVLVPTSPAVRRDPPPSSSEAAPPKPWYKQESRSKPGKFYYVNAETGITRWDFPPADVVPEPVPEPKSSKRFSLRSARSSKHDYRDEIYVQDQSPDVAEGTSREEEEDPLDVSWSRAAAMTCEHSSAGTKGGVRGLSILDATTDTRRASKPEANTDSSDTVSGDTFKWVRGEVIGRGALGIVFKALDQQTGRMMAVKEVLINAADTDDNKFLQDLKNEVDILKNLQHPHIVSYLGHDYIDGSLYMYLEHMPGGTVTQALQQFGVFEEVLLADYSKQVLLGLEYLHTSDPPVVHRDIKGSNILLGLDCKAKLADFGCSRRTNQTLTHTMRGSVPWMAPEVIAFSRFGRSADMWSFGCFVIEMGTASVPWGRFDNQMAALVKIGMSKAMPKLPEDISDICKAFINRCLQRQEDLRPSATELLSDELFKVVLTDFD